MEQGYIISTTNLSGKVDFLDMVFKDYSESRKIAKKMANRRNKKIIYQTGDSSCGNQILLMSEISPDLWVCSEEIIKIEVIKVKEIITKKTIKRDLLQKYRKEIEALEFVE